MDSLCCGISRWGQPSEPNHSRRKERCPRVFLSTAWSHRRQLCNHLDDDGPSSGGPLSRQPIMKMTDLTRAPGEPTPTCIAVGVGRPYSCVWTTSSALCTSPMPRNLLFIVLIAAVILLGPLSHASMAGGSAGEPGMCHHAQRVLMDRGDASGHCGPADHSMARACATACLGTIAITLPDAGLVPLPSGFHGLWTPTKLVLRGRQTAPDDRPPKPI